MKKPSLQYSLTCLGVDERHGPPSFNYVFYRLPLASFPYRFPADAGFFLVNAWCDGEGEFKQRVVITDPDGQTTLLDTGQRPFKLESPRALDQSIWFLQGFSFHVAGFYPVKVYLEDQVVLEYAIEAYETPS